MVEYLSPYLDMFRLRIRKSKPISHQQTCPICGRTLVNLYRHNGVWKCNKCWNAEERGGEDG